MADRVISDGLWSEITRLAKKYAPSSDVAVAYFGSAGSQLLPLEEGSSLTVDASEAAVRSGQTNPSELLKLLKRGVTIYSLEGLHAKVFVMGQSAIVGSPNVSEHSRSRLVECGLLTVNRQLVSQCRRWIRNLPADELGPEELAALSAMYRPPKFAGAPKARRSKPRREGARLWVIHTQPIEFSKRDFEIEEAVNEAIREERLLSRGHETLTIRWTGRGLAGIAVRDSVITINDEGAGRVLVEPPGRILKTRTYRVNGSERRLLVYEQPTRRRRKRLEVVKRKLGRSLVSRLNKIRGARIVTDPDLSGALRSLWRE